MGTVTKWALAIIGTLSVLSWVLGNLLDCLNVNVNREGNLHPLSGSPPFPDDQFHHIFWFVPQGLVSLSGHSIVTTILGRTRIVRELFSYCLLNDAISDIHISRYWDPQRVEDLKTFCTEYVNIIQPPVVLVSGDLTDAKSVDFQGSQQYEDEWITYDKVLKETKVTEKTVWLDVRGNHDAFNVPSLTSDNNYYRIYSVRGKKHLSNYLYTHKTKDGKYSFIAVDACPVPGPKRPFNFFGSLNQASLRTLSDYAWQSRASNMTVWFGHYPSSTVLSPKPGLRKILSKGSVYLCGHLHTLGGIIPKMYTMHQGGNLELELADWKDNRRYRILTVDHGLLSFTDVTFGEWPVVVISNPKHALYNMPTHEPVGRMRHSSHIRILAFSPGHIVSVKVEINGVVEGEATHVKGPLYVLPWTAQKYERGMHKITVIVKDSLGHHKRLEQPFSLDDSHLKFDILPRLILMMDIAVLGKVLFSLTVLGAVLPLIIIRFFKDKFHVSPQFTGVLVRFVTSWISRIYLVSSTNSIVLPLLAYAAYIAMGPWFIGELLDGYVGVCFVFGLYVNGTFIPGDLTYLYGIFQFLTFNIPLMLYLGKCLEVRAFYYKNSWDLKSMSWCDYFSLHSIFYLLMLWQASCAYHGFYLAYGTMAFLLGPMRTWSILLAIYLRNKARETDRYDKWNPKSYDRL